MARNSLVRRTPRAALLTLLLLLLAPDVGRGQDAADGPTYLRDVQGVAARGYLNTPLGVAVSPADDQRVFVVDRGNARVQAFDSSAFAVLGMWGQAGNGRGDFWQPSDVATGPNGNYVYVVDSGSRRVQRFRPDPVCFEPDGREGCFSGPRVLRWGGAGTGDGLFQYPTGLATDRAGNVYVADAGAHEVQVFDADGRFAFRFGFDPEGGPSALKRPTDLAVGPDGRVWVADRDNHRLAFYSLEGAYEGMWRGGGDIRLYKPTGVAVGADGSFVVMDYEPSFRTPRARRFAADRTLLWELDLAGRGGGTATFPLQGAALLPGGVAVLSAPHAAEDNLVMVTPGGDRIRMASRGRDPSVFDAPNAVALEGSLLAVADRANERVTVLDTARDDAVVGVVGGLSGGQLDLLTPSAVALHRPADDPEGARLLVADADRHTVHVLRPDGRKVTSWGDGTMRADENGFNQPLGLDVASDGSVYVADYGNNRVVHRAPGGEVLGLIGADRSAPGALSYPIAVAVGPDERVYVLEFNRHALKAFAPDGTFLGEWESTADYPPAPGELWIPVALAADAHYLYVLENDGTSGLQPHVRVQVLTPPDPERPLVEHVVTVFADRAGPGQGQVANPLGIAAADGEVAVADTGNGRVQLFQWPRPATPETPTPAPTATERPPATAVPTDAPTEAPTRAPTDAPTTVPTDDSPTVEPTATTVPPTTAPTEPPPATATPLVTPPPDAQPTPRTRYRVYLPRLERARR